MSDGNEKIESSRIKSTCSMMVVGLCGLSHCQNSPISDLADTEDSHACVTFRERSTLVHLESLNMVDLHELCIQEV